MRKQYGPPFDPHLVTSNAGHDTVGVPPDEFEFSITFAIFSFDAGVKLWGRIGLCRSELQIQIAQIELPPKPDNLHLLRPILNCLV